MVRHSAGLRTARCAVLRAALNDTSLRSSVRYVGGDSDVVRGDGVVEERGENEWLHETRLDVKAVVVLSSLVGVCVVDRHRQHRKR